MNDWLRGLLAVLCLGLATTSPAQDIPYLRSARIAHFSADVPAEAGEADALGSKVAVSGDVMVAAVPQDDIGASSDQGSVYVFEREDDGWRRRYRLNAPDGFAGQRFGFDIALDGDVMAVSALSSGAEPGGRQESAVYLYHLVGVEWLLQDKLLPLDASLERNFGQSVDVSGDTLLVGSLLGNSGRVHSYRRNGTNWSYESEILSPTPVSLFGSDVAIDGAYAVVGAPRVEREGNSNWVGAAYVYEHVGAGWILRADLVPLDDLSFVISRIARFGQSVAISGQTILVGAPYSDRPGMPGVGAAFAFTQIQGSWKPQFPALYDDTGPNGGLGNAVALDGTTALVAAQEFKRDGQARTGRVRVFERRNVSWVLRPEELLPDTLVGDGEKLGASVALDDGVAVIGAAFADGYQSLADIGKVYTFGFQGTGWQRLHGFQLPDGASGDQLGSHMVVDGDTMLLGMPDAENRDADRAGRVRVMRRVNGRWQHEANLVVPGVAASGERFGWSIALKGDTAVIGAPYVDDGIVDSGAVYVYRRTGTTWSLPVVVHAPQRLAGDHFGGAVAIDSSNAARIAVAASQGDTQTPDAGVVHQFERSGTQWMWRSRINSPTAQVSEFGSALRFEGDRLIVGNAGHDEAGIVDAGVVYVFGQDANQQWSLLTTFNNPMPQRGSDRFGFALDSFRNSNGLLIYVGAPEASVSGIDRCGGVVRIIIPTLDPSQTIVTPFPAPPGLRFGDRFGSAIDYRDNHLLVGAPYADPVAEREQSGVGIAFDTGAAYFYRNGAANTAMRLETHDRSEDHQGASVALGALDATQMPEEILLGAPGRDSSARSGPEAGLHVNDGEVDVFDRLRVFSDGFE